MSHFLSGTYFLPCLQSLAYLRGHFFFPPPAAGYLGEGGAEGCLLYCASAAVNSRKSLSVAFILALTPKPPTLRMI